jgi:RND family efflux transporter MFP subunit
MAENAEPLRKHLEALRLERRPAPGPAPKGRRRLVVGIVVVVLAALAAWRAFTPRPIPVQVATVTAPALAAGAEGVPVLSGAGYVVSAERYISIGVRVAGRIERYLVEEGDRVSRGDALVQIDAREYEAALRRAEANLRLARANATLKDKQLRRARALAGEGVVSREDLDIRATEADTAHAQVGQAEAELHQAKVAFEYTTLRAPASGVILAKLKEVGEIAVPGGFSGSGDLIRMANLEELRGQVDVTESELAKIALGQRADVVPDAHPDRRYRATVVKLYPQVDRQKGTLRVEVRIEEPDDRLWPDMSARITFYEPLPAAPDGATSLLVPRSAVHADGTDAHFVWRLDDDRVRRVPIALGKEFADQVQVTKGLAEGERIVVGDATTLSDGARVAPAGRH